MLGSQYEEFVLIFRGWFLSICPKNIVPDVLWFVQKQLCKPKTCYYVGFKEKRLSPKNPSRKRINLFSLFLIVFICWVVHFWEHRPLSQLFTLWKGKLENLPN